jgi:hypothetical protein
VVDGDPVGERVAGQVDGHGLPSDQCHGKPVAVGSVSIAPVALSPRSTEPPVVLSSALLLTAAALSECNPDRIENPAAPTKY